MHSTFVSAQTWEMLTSKKNLHKITSINLSMRSLLTYINTACVSLQNNYYFARSGRFPGLR